MTTGRGPRDPEALKAKWDERYRRSERVPPPAPVLLENLHLLPRSGRALDLACGLGVNALLLAQRGLEVTAWDLSAVAIERLQHQAKVRGRPIRAQVRDLQARPPRPKSFDVIVASYFLERDLAPALSAALCPGGLLFYQTFCTEAVSDCGPSNPAFRLATNELLGMFPDLIVRFYREEGRTGDITRGTRDLAMLVAQKPGTPG
ncbi:MAG: class I SAM-dependent methyltransferase [Pseudomonadota bacterium]|nr:class I SAM-dependent methyltransferase [Pseudomonadota bacterium]